MSKKRANGEGNIRKRKNGRWEGRYTAGYDLGPWHADPPERSPVGDRPALQL